MRYDVWFIVFGLVFMLVGEALGFWMGAIDTFTYADVHAHINLIGWVEPRALTVSIASRLSRARAVQACAAAISDRHWRRAGHGRRHDDAR